MSVLGIRKVRASVLISICKIKGGLLLENSGIRVSNLLAEP
jgi:hypothetical protein